MLDNRGRRNRRSQRGHAGFRSLEVVPINEGSYHTLPLRHKISIQSINLIPRRVSSASGSLQGCLHAENARDRPLQYDSMRGRCRRVGLTGVGQREVARQFMEFRSDRETKINNLAGYFAWLPNALHVMQWSCLVRVTPKAGGDWPDTDAWSHLSSDEVLSSQKLPCSSSRSSK